MGRALALCSFLLLAAPAAWAELALSGFLQQNTVFNTVTANPDGRAYKWLEERARLQLDAGAGAWRLLAKGDFAYDHLGRGGEAEWREAYVDYTAERWDLRAGRQVLTWGLGDLVFVNDVFPKDHEALLAGRPLEYLKLGVDAVKLDAYPGFAAFELVLMPDFRASRTPDPARFHRYDPLPGVTDRDTDTPGRGETALRIYRDIAGVDAALYLYRGFARTPALRPDSLTAPSRLRYFYPALSAYGTSLSGRAGVGVLSLEGAYYDAREDRSGNDPSVPNAQTRLLIGYQLQPIEDLTLGFQYHTERMHDYGAYRAALPTGFPAEERSSHTVTARVTQFFQHQTLKLSVYAAYNTGTGDRFVNPELRYGFSDAIWGAVGANRFAGPASGAFGQFARDDNVYLQIRYEF